MSRDRARASADRRWRKLHTFAPGDYATARDGLLRKVTSIVDDDVVTFCRERGEESWPRAALTKIEPKAGEKIRDVNGGALYWQRSSDGKRMLQVFRPDDLAQ